MPARDSYALEATVRDQRTMVGYDVHRHPDDVKAAWDRWAREKGFGMRRRSGDPSLELRYSRKTVTAYVSDNCWTGDCPTCGGGVPTWPGHDEGCCLDCGTVYKIAYPADAEIAAGVEALEARPPRNRHWHPHTGETAEQLRLDNIANGFHPTKPHAEQETPPLVTLTPEEARDLARLVPAEHRDELRRLGLEV